MVTFQRKRLDGFGSILEPAGSSIKAKQHYQTGPQFYWFVESIVIWYGFSIDFRRPLPPTSQASAVDGRGMGGGGQGWGRGEG